MSYKMFSKKIAPSCEYCVFGHPSAYTEEVICEKKGITNFKDSCRKYKYDPLKREPKRQKIAGGYSEEDFKL